MKEILFGLIVLITPVTLLAQSKKVRLHAYQQPVMSGTRNITVEEKGVMKEVPKKVNPNIFIYLEAPPSMDIQPEHLWINGKLYSVRATDAQPPVVMYNNTVPGKKADTLVRLTGNRVVQLMPDATTAEFIPSKTAQKKMKKNELVLHTVEYGKNCYYYVQHIKLLEPVALQ
jgi:hypothetical protein